MAAWRWPQGVCGVLIQVLILRNLYSNSRMRELMMLCVIRNLSGRFRMSGTTFELFAVSALFLYMELVFIRWLPAQVLFLTFFTNTVLLASFLGLSLGCLAARRNIDYLPLTPVLLAVVIGAGSAMEWIRLALQDIIDVGRNKVSPQMVFFGAEVRVHDVAKFAIPIELVAGAFFLLVAATIIGLGQILGRRFAAIS